MSDSPKWVSCKHAKIAQQVQIARHGGLFGVRDGALLILALESPRNR